MKYRSFTIRILFRIVIQFLLLGAFFYFVFATGQILRSIYFFSFFIIALFELIWFINRTNRDYSNFLLSILQNDFTTTFTRKHEGKPLDDFYNSLNQITNKFREIGAEKETQYLFLEMLVQHVKVGIITYDESGEIRIVNDAFCDLAGKKYIKDLNSLKKLSPELLKEIMDLKPDRPKLVKIQLYGKLQQLSLLSNIFKVEDQTFKLVSFQNIKNELEAGEVDAWQKIIRVLTHEIMNSITPITSLSDTLLDIVGSANEKQLSLDKDSVSKIFIGLKAIKERSGGLKTFSKAYQSLTRLPAPEFTTINSNDFLETIRVLVGSELQSGKILLETTVEPSDHTFLADSEQITQVILNLVKNSKEALLSTGDNIERKITVSIVGKKGQTEIDIHDNGPGIQEEFREKIFIPFFTTKKKGSGIGLALARQIIRQHNGTIQMDSEGGNGTTARISL